MSFAEKSGDRTLAGRVKFSRSGVTAGSGNAIVARAIVDPPTAGTEATAPAAVAA